MTAEPQAIAMIGAGAMGGSFAAVLAKAGHRLTLIDTDAAHADVIRRDGLVVESAIGRISVNVPIAPDITAPGTADLAVVFVTSRDTVAAAPMVAKALKPGAPALTLQNGIGNVEALQAVLGRDRVLAGSTKCSAARPEPGRPMLTHIKETVIGELDGVCSPRVVGIAKLMTAAGLPTVVHDNITGVLWDKLGWNTALNGLSAVTGLRLAEVARTPELDRMRDQLVDEFLALARAKGILLPDPDIKEAIRRLAWTHFTKPSMMQHLEARRQTEIDAINGAVVREARTLGIAVPYNEAVVALVKGCEAALAKAGRPEPNYTAMEAEAARSYTAR